MGAYREHDRERWVAEDPAQKRSDRDDFARDRGRLVHSAALRRLAAKTQVMRPDTDDFIRTRLTHSLEVAQIGREFGADLGCDADVVDTACLAHDVGHPPFGHHGELVLDGLSADIGGFEGNAQTLRILTRLEAKRAHPSGRSAGLNLTRASLDATVKYPWLRADAPPTVRKYSAYDDDADAFAWIRQGAPADDPRRRCLEAQVMDWSDDVAYSVHDIEDGVARGFIDLRVWDAPDAFREVCEVARRWCDDGLTDDELAEAASRLRAGDAIPSQPFDGTRASLAALKDMTSRLIGHFVSAVESATRQRHGPGPRARYEADLVIPASTWAECCLLKAVAAHFVMLTDERRRDHAQQTEIVEMLAAAYRDRPERLDPMFWVDLEAVGEGGAMRVIVDQVASLSDARAVELWHRWSHEPTSAG
ncbi:MAG: deoxyguanosinetriphosphate triphosphohydrolase [Dermatophilaceae bacterium]